MDQLEFPQTSLLEPYGGDSVLPLYTATVAVSGGEVGNARASGKAVSDDGALDLVLRLPSELGGNGAGTNPEQLFAAGFAACLHGTLTLVAASRDIRLPRNFGIVASVAFCRDPSDGMFLITADLDVALPAMDPDVAQSLMEETKRVCPYAKMARTGTRSTINLR
jgi:lipoyl-dependent peroxiredoxin